MRLDGLSPSVAVRPAAAQHDHIAVGCDPRRAVHPVGAWLVRGGPAAKSLRSPPIFACPAVQVTLPQAVAGLVEDQGKDGSTAQELEIGPCADALNRRLDLDAGWLDRTCGN